MASATIAASSIGDRTVLRRSFGPIGISSTDSRLRHLTTVFSLIPTCLASCATEACYRCSSARTACVVLALPCKTCPINPSSAMMTILHHNMLGLTT